MRSLGLACLLLFTTAGCQVPLLIYPAPEAGSGMRLRLQDEDGRILRENGLLIVYRSYFNVPLFTGLSAPPVVDVMEITGGEVRMPHKWALASIYIWWFYYIPTPGIFPGDNLLVLPLVPGYFVPRDPEFSEHCLRHYEHIQDGTVTLCRTVDDPEGAQYYLQTSVLGKLRRTTDPPPEPGRWDFCLPDKQYERVKTLVEQELLQLKRTYGDLPHSQPANAEDVRREVFILPPSSLIPPCTAEP